MTTEDTNGDVGSGAASGSGYEGSARENDEDFINKKAGVLKQVIRKTNMELFTLGHIFCELNVLHEREFTYQVHYEVILRINDVTKKTL